MVARKQKGGRNHPKRGGQSLKKSPEMCPEVAKRMCQPEGRE